MRYCYNCGRQIPDKAKFCPYCSIELTIASEEPANQTAPPPSPSITQATASAPPKKSHTLRNVIIAVLLVVLVAGALGEAFTLGIQQGGNKTVTTTVTKTPIATAGQTQLEGMQTWQGYGMSIQVPDGLTPQLGQINSTTGQVGWSWNGNNTGIVLLWDTTSGYNTTAGFEGIYQRMLGEGFTSISVTAEGNITMSAHAWAYETFTIVYQGSTYYSATALSYYPASGRAYSITYADTIPNTLVSLAVYGNTFQG